MRFKEVLQKIMWGNTTRIRYIFDFSGFSGFQWVFSKRFIPNHERKYNKD